MIQINLAPDVKQELIKAQRIRAKVIAGSMLIGAASVAVVASLAMYVFTVQTLRNINADKAIVSGSSTLSNIADLSKTLTIQNQLSKISTINSSKKIDSRIFDVLGVIIPPAPNQVQISNLLISADTKTITIEGQAANSYAAVDVFKKMIEGSKVKFTDAKGEQKELTLASDISISNTSYAEDASNQKVLRFTISFVYTPELFSLSSKDLSVIIKTDGNVTDSYLGVPNSIFADRAKDIIPAEEQ